MFTFGRLFTKSFIKAFTEAFQEYADEVAERKTPTARTMEGELRQASHMSVWMMNPTVLHCDRFAFVTGPAVGVSDDMAMFNSELEVRIPEFDKSPSWKHLFLTFEGGSLTSMLGQSEGRGLHTVLVSVAD